MDVLTVKNLSKEYPAFKLNHVSFNLEKGKISGFIGRNGAGKSTTLNSLFNYVHPDSGEIEFFGMDFNINEADIKGRIGFVSSGVNFYPRKKLKKISAVSKTFYPDWDDTAYDNYMKMFKLDENKTPSQLSAGMKVKYALTLALSHNADLLILDEPTSGIDPVSRDELLDIFMDLADDGKTILFSTHITTDLDKCADNIIYIKNGNIIAESKTADFENAYKLVLFDNKEELEEYKQFILGVKRSRTGYSALIRTKYAKEFSKDTNSANLEEIMIHLEKEEYSND